MKNSMVVVKGLKEFQGVKFVKIILRRGGGYGLFPKMPIPCHVIILKTVSQLGKMFVLILML